MEYWKVSESPHGIVITCRDHDKKGTVGVAVNEFGKLAAARSGNFTIFADLREMTGYETPSRVAWQQVFLTFRKQIDGLVLIGARTATIRMGAAVVGAFAGIPVRFVDSWDQLDTKKRSA